jgi:mannose-6-phosphate isomerase-like protein (cupin superfamily)
MGYTMCDIEDVEKMHGVFRPIRRTLGVTAFGINHEDLPPNGDGYPDHDHTEDGQQEVFYVLAGAGKMVVDGEDVELKPGRFVYVEPESKRQILPGDEGLELICVGAPPGAYKVREG